MRGYRGNIIYSPSLGRLDCVQGGIVLVDENGIVEGVYDALPESTPNVPVTDFEDRLIIPAFSDLHLHSSQLSNRAMGYDGEFSEWLTKYTYPVDKLYAQPEFAHKLNKRLIHELWENGITRSAIMSSTSFTATSDLIEQFMQSGLCAFIGKMNSDLGAFGDALETTEVSKRETLQMIERFMNQSGRVKYILSPEFIPCCTDEMMEFLGGLARQHNLPVQSHLSESPGDVGMVAARYPQDGSYCGVYRRFGLFGQTPTLMAHCLYNTEDEVRMMSEHQVYAVHCPISNLNVPSGRNMPLRHFLNNDIPVGLGSDVAGGHTLNVMQNMVAAVQVSKQVAVEKPEQGPITAQEAFYLATKGGGSFFGKVGSFERGYDFDALVIDDNSLDDFMVRTLDERLVRFIYRGAAAQIIKRFCMGKELLDII